MQTLFYLFFLEETTVQCGPILLPLLLRRHHSPMRTYSFSSSSQTTLQSNANLFFFLFFLDDTTVQCGPILLPLLLRRHCSPMRTYFLPLLLRCHYSPMRTDSSSSSAQTTLQSNADLFFFLSFLDDTTVQCGPILLPLLLRRHYSPMRTYSSSSSSYTTPQSNADLFLLNVLLSVRYVFLSLFQNFNFAFINLLKTEHNLLYIRNQSVPRCKHFPPRL